MSKELRQLVKEINRHGWDAQKRKNNHLVLIGPQGQKVFCSSTPSDRRALENIKRDLRRNGCSV